jgi:hypothetical protein
MAPPTDIYRLTNPTCGVAVSAATGRIIRYGPLHGPNVLWENPRARETSTPMRDWLNWGGDKVWIWPEEDWRKWRPGQEFPPGDPSPTPHAVHVHGRSLRMVSPIEPAYGIRVIREITLDETGAGVTLVNRLEKLQPGSQSLGVAPWTVTQIPAIPQILARLIPNPKPPGYAPFPPHPWNDVHTTNNIVILSRPGDPWVKMGLDADVLAAPIHGFLFIVRTLSHDPVPGVFAPWRRAQVFSDPDVSTLHPPGISPYVELEFTAPVRELPVGESASLTIRWDLISVPQDQRPIELLAGLA